MLKTSIIEGTNVVSLTVEGSISADEDLAAQKAVEQVASAHGSARMLLDYEGVDLSRVEPRAVWEDLKGSRLLGDIDRIGIVSESSVLEAFAQLTKAVSDMEVRTFESGQRDAAVAWLSS